MVMGKGSFTTTVSFCGHSHIPFQHTDNITAEESINPAHDQRVGDNHSHVILHHAHHSIHRTGVREGVRRWLPLGVRILEELARLEARNERVTTGLERLARQDVVVAAQGDAEVEAALLTGGLGVEFLGRGSHQDGGIVTEDTGLDHDNGDGDQDPVAGVVSLPFQWHDAVTWSGTYNNWGSR